MIERMKALLRENSMGVLATCLNDRPHCSLMAYVTDESAENVYMVTLRASQKYSNLSQNPNVSLLVDSRMSGNTPREHIQALTLSGVCSTPRDERDRKSALHRIEEKHPHLQELVNNPDVEVICVSIKTLLLLDGPATAHFESLQGGIMGPGKE
jgi:general stress protein 26